MFGQNWSSVEKKRLQYFTWMCSLKGMFSTMQHVSLSQGRWHHFVKNVAMDIFLVFDCAFHSYFALQSFSNCKRPLKSVLLMTALFEYFLFIIWLIRYSQKLKFACNKWGERTPQCIYSSQKNYDITVVLFACHLTLHPRVEHAVKPLNLAQQTLGNQWVGWRQGSCTFKPAFFDQKRV